MAELPIKHDAEHEVTIDPRVGMESKITINPVATEAEVEQLIPGFAQVYHEASARVMPLLAGIDIRQPALMICDQQELFDYVNSVQHASISPSYQKLDGSKAFGIYHYSVWDNAIYINRQGTSDRIAAGGELYAHALRYLAEELIHAATTFVEDGKFRVGHTNFGEVPGDPKDRFTSGVYVWNRETLTDDEINALPQDRSVFVPEQEDSDQIHRTEHLTRLIILDLFGEEEQPPADVIAFMPKPVDTKPHTRKKKKKRNAQPPVLEKPLVIQKQVIRHMFGASKYTFAQHCMRSLQAGTEESIQDLVAPIQEYARKHMLKPQGVHAVMLAHVLQNLHNTQLGMIDLPSSNFK